MPARSLRLPLLFAAALAATAPAAADCPADLVANFDGAVAEKSVDGEIHAMTDISMKVACNTRIDEFRRRLIDSMIDIADDPQAPAAERQKALERAQGDISIGGTWRHAERMAHFYARGNDKLKAYEWYEAAISKVATMPSERPTGSEFAELENDATAAKILASNDEGGKIPAKFAAASPETDGKIRGIYSVEMLRAVGISAVPLPINFYTDQATFTPVGEKAAAELAEVLKQQDVRTMTLVGHADPRGDHQYNVALSKRRAAAVREYLLAKGVAAHIDIDGKGPDQPFKVSTLGYPVSQDEEWALDRRVEWLFDAPGQ